MVDGKKPLDKANAFEKLMWKSIKSGLGSIQDDVGHAQDVEKHAKPIQKTTNHAQSTVEHKAAAPGATTKVKVSLVKECRVCIKPSGKAVSVIMAKIPSAKYEIKETQWTFDVEHYETVVKELAAKKIHFDKIPAGTLALARKSHPDCDFVLQGGIYDTLMEFQREAVRFALNRNGRILLADDMGLGKTIEALAIANHYRIEYPLLILCPASLCYNWYDSVQRFLNEEANIVKEKCDLGNRIIVMSYNIAVTFAEEIGRIRPGVVISDECHYFKSATTKRTKTLIPILQRAARLVMISGTPATSRPLELYPIITALDKSLYPSFQVYGNRYCDGRKIGHYYDYRGCSNAIELAVVMEKAFMIRRTKEMVLGQLPKKFRRQVLLETSGCEIPVNDRASERFFSDTQDGQIMVEYAQAAQVKIKPVTKYLEIFLERETKFLVFAHHKEMLDALERFCVEKSVKYVRIDGATPTARRQLLVEQFQGDSGVKIAVLSLTACSTGLTLTQGKVVVFAELYWNPGTMLQAEDRIHRIGQVDNVNIHYLVAKGTIDEKVWPKLLKKLTVLESLGIGKNELKLVKGAEAGAAVQGRLNFRNNCD